MFVGLLPLVSAEVVSTDLVFGLSASIALVAFLAIGIDSFRYVRKMSKSQRAQVQDINFYLSWALAMITIISLVFVVSRLFPIVSQGVYLFAALGGLALCTSNFLTLAFERLFKHRPEDE